MEIVKFLSSTPKKQNLFNFKKINDDDVMVGIDDNIKFL